ncbi:MAG: DUF309 domain-containing protein [Planctomycetaceae bacterium]
MSSATAKRKPAAKAKSPKAAKPEQSSDAAATSQEVAVSRLLPSTELPAYTHIPGSDTPHPYRDPRGHSYQRKHPGPKGLTPTTWAENRSYLLALDYFNFGYYWEAHEEWERLLRASGVDTATGRFLKGLVKLSAAGLKVREQSIHGVRRHAASAGEVFADVAAEVDSECFCGLRFTLLQFAADRAAQLSYQEDVRSGQPRRVFPFLIMPEPFPLA